MSYTLTGDTGYSRPLQAGRSFPRQKHKDVRDVSQLQFYQHKEFKTNFPSMPAKYRDGSAYSQIQDLDAHMIRLCRELTVAKNSNRPNRVAKLNDLLSRAERERNFLFNQWNQSKAK